MNKKIYVIIVTYNGMQWIDRCLISVLHSGIQVQTIVIDNASTDGTPEYIQQQFPEVELISSLTNLGFGQANNAGLKKAIEYAADFVMLLNQDAWIDASMIAKLIEVSIKNPSYGIISPFHFNYDGTRVEKYFNDFVIGNYTPEYINDYICNAVKPIYATSFIHAACWLLPINTIKQTGGFDPLFFHYGEDNDYVQRLRFKKMKIGFVPGAVFYHKGSNEVMNSREINIRFRVNDVVLQLKNPAASPAGALLVFFKNTFDVLGSSLLYRNIKQFHTEFKVFVINLKRIRAIIKSGKIQKKSLAYLTEVI